MGDFVTPPDVLALAGLEALPAQTPDERSGIAPRGGAAEAARRLLNQQAVASVGGPYGDPTFVSGIARLVLGEGAVLGDCLAGVASSGDSGTLRLAAELYRRARPSGWVWIGMPTVADQAAIFAAAGVPAAVFPLFDSETSQVRLEATLAALAHASPGDAILLSDRCYGLSDTQLTREQWGALIELVKQRGLLPIVDLARHGLGEGLTADAAGVRAVFAALPEAILVYHCEETFGLTDDTAGALLVQASTAEQATIVRDTLSAIGHVGWSLRTTHGAATVRAILSDPALTGQWQTELAAARGRRVGPSR